jgi:hypothetical protein
MPVFGDVWKKFGSWCTRESVYHRVSRSDRLQDAATPRLNFISTNVVFFIEEWSDVKTGHHLLLKEGGLALPISHYVVQFLRFERA